MDKQQTRVKEFMLAAGQEVPAKITIPDSKTRILRVRLLLEEVLEFAEASGVKIGFYDEKETPLGRLYPNIKMKDFGFIDSGRVDLVEVADGLGDINYVSYGAALAYGIDLEPVEDAIQFSNMAKFGPGGYRDENGKWRKPPNWQPPNIEKILMNQK